MQTAVVFKTLEHNVEPLEWEREVSLYTRLFRLWEGRNYDEETNPFKYIVQYLGSFAQPRELPDPRNPGCQTTRYTIILEYVTGGTLDNFFRTQHGLVNSLEDRKHLWRHMFDLLLGVHMIHNLGDKWKG